MNLVLVEDDSRVASFLERGLRAEGHAVTVAHSGPEGLTLIAASRPDVAILDLMLPGMTGLEICQALRAARNRVPILMLTAMTATEDKIGGLRMGADDYMTKPFSFDELLARLEALHRRVSGVDLGSVLAVGKLTFNRETLEVRLGERLVELTAKELALLELLMSAPGKVFSRARILNAVWGMSADPLTNVVDVYVRRLRSKIGAGEDSTLIKTVRGFGYKIDANGDAAN